MNDAELDYARKLAELDQLLNDPEVPMQPARVWSLLAEISCQDHIAPVAQQPQSAMMG